MSLWVTAGVSLQTIGKIQKGVKKAIASNLRFQAFAWRHWREKTKLLRPGQSSKFKTHTQLFLLPMYELFKVESINRFLILVLLIWYFSVRRGRGGPNKMEETA